MRGAPPLSAAVEMVSASVEMEHRWLLVLQPYRISPPSSPGLTGGPGKRGRSRVTIDVTGYWIARLKRAMTGRERGERRCP